MGEKVAKKQVGSQKSYQMRAFRLSEVRFQ